MTTSQQNPINHPQAKALAKLLAELRPDWDERGIMATLEGARTRAGNFDLTLAALRAAATPTNRTPAIIAMDGPHWHTPTVTTVRAPVVDAVARCQACGGLHTRLAPCDPPETQRSHGRGAEAARAALRGTDR